MSDLITLKVRLVDKKVFKKFQFYPKKTVKEARLFIAAELEVDPEQYGLFLPPKDDQNGVWFRDDYPLDFYGLEGENEKEALLFTSKDSPQMEFVEFKKRYRPIKVAKGDNQFRTLMVDDTMNVADIVKYVSTQVPISSAIDEDQTVTNIYEMEVLSNDMTIREQGYVGECTTNLSRSSKGDLNLCVQVPYFEGFIMRKRGGGLIKGLKNWNKRWYSLRKNRLLYYKSKSDTNEMGCILMKTVQTVRPAREVAEIPSKYLKMCFEIVTPARTFVMLASNVNEMKKWVEILDSSRRMFAYETHFFGVANKKISEGGSALNGDDSDEEGEYQEEKLQKAKRLQAEQRLEKERQEQEKQATAEKERKEEQERQERVRLEQEQQERLFIEQELIRAEEERKERIRLEQEEQERQEQERRRVEEEEMIKMMMEEEERRRKLEEKRQEDLRKIQEEQELLERQQQEFIAKQQQLELEKQRQLQDQLEEDRRLEELMLQMEMDQEERIKVKEEQERQEQEKLEQAKLLAQEEERLKEEQERIRIEQERVIKERQEEERRMEEERQEEKRVEAERQEKIRIEKEERERREEEEKKEKEKKRQEEELRIKLEKEEKLRIFEEEKKKQQEEERIRVAEQQEQIRKERLEQEEKQRVEQLRLEEERERLEQQQQQDESTDDNENVDMLDEFEREEEEREKEQLASKRLRSLQARLESVCAETPELKLLLSESILTTPENLLLSWANYIVSGISSPSLHSSSRSQIPGGDSLSYSSSSSHHNATLSGSGQGTGGNGDDGTDGTSNGTSGATGGRILKPSTASVTLVPSTASIGANAMGGNGAIGDPTRATILSSTHLVSTQAVSHVQLKDLKSLDANLEMYASLLFKLEPQEFDLQHFVSLSTNAEKAQYIHATLVKLGVTTVTVEQLLSSESDSHLNILLTIYEEVGGEQWKEEFHTQVVSKRSFATKYISQLLTNSIGLTVAQSPLDLLPTLMSGRVLCELINKVYPGTIDDRVIIKTEQFCKNNLMLAANATKALGGQQIPDIDFLSENGNHVSTTILHNLTWAIVETCLLQSADPSKNRHLFHLLRAETRTSFMKLEKEKIMLRWFNYHLRKGSNRSINNFTDDLEDCENYAYLFAVIAPQHSLKSEILKESDWEKRAEMVLAMAAKIGCMSLLSPRDIVETENSQLNQLFVADIMRVAHGLPAYQFRLDVEQLDDQVQKSKDQGNNDTELLQWVNSLGIEGVEAKHLLDDFKSGYLFLKIFEKVTPPGTLDPKKFRTNPTSVFKMVELCNYTMEICHKFKLNLAGTAGTDLANGDIRSNRAILNQIRRVIIGEKTTVDSVISNQSVALKWANSKIGIDVKVKSIQSFKDQFLQDGLFLLELLSSIENNSVNRKYINTVCSTEEQQESNCRYFLSCAWAAGIPLNVLWEDVQKVRSKSIKHIVETLQSWDTIKLTTQQQQLTNNNNNTTTTTTTTTTTSNI